VINSAPATFKIRGNGRHLPQVPARLLAIVGSLVLSSCATMMSGPRQAVKIDSVPQGARVFTGVVSRRQGKMIRRTEVGVTPMTVSITRKDGVVELEKEGYLVTRVPMRKGTNLWFLGNFLLTSSVSTSVDLSTGAYNEYDPDQYVVELQPQPDWTRPASTVTDSAALPPSSAAEDEGEPYVPDVRPLSPPPAPN
jgi:hypothetical protein